MSDWYSEENVSDKELAEYVIAYKQEAKWQQFIGNNILHDNYMEIYYNLKAEMMRREENKE